jgi:dTDP-4-dehydrorhamnose reductase
MIIIYGSTGFIGSHIVKELSNYNSKDKIKKPFFLCSKTRIWDYTIIKKEIQLYKPTAVINATGFSTPSNIDYYEQSIDNKSKLILTNTAGNVILASACKELNVHYITIMSGCIFESEKGEYYTDKDKPNFYGSLYSKNRIITEELLSIYDNITIIRIRMPVSSYMHNKSLINKLIQYKYITCIPNSITILDDCIPKIIDIINNNITGIINLVNNGNITNAYICYLYKNMINNNHTYQIATPKIIDFIMKGKPRRSNCILQPSKCLGEMPDVKKSINLIFKDFKRIKDIYC